jgi:hypothetical protein
MSGATPELNLATAVDADDNADYLTLSLANSLRTVDALFNNVTGHNHGAAHSGGPITSVPAGAIPPITSAMIADGTIQTADIADSAVTSAKIADGTISSTDMAAGAAAGNVGALSNALTGFLPSPALASGVAITSPVITNPVINGTVSGSPAFGAFTAWVPSISQGGASITCSGYAGYQVVGKHVTVSVYLTVTSSSANGSGSPVTVTSIPLPPKQAGPYMTVGSFTYLRSGNTAIAGVVVLPSNPQIQFNAFSSTGGGMMGVSPAFSVALNDALSFTINYETT